MTDYDLEVGLDEIDDLTKEECEKQFKKYCLSIPDFVIAFQEVQKDKQSKIEHIILRRFKADLDFIEFLIDQKIYQQG